MRFPLSLHGTSAGNMAGRLGWAAASDYIGRKRTYLLFGLGVPICLAVPSLTAAVATSQDAMPLVSGFAPQL